MQLKHQKITLDVNDTRAFTVLNAHQGDSKTRFIEITLTDSGNAITLSSNYVATVKASINNKTKAVNTAVVDATKNVITVELTKTMLDTPGLLNCEVILQDNQQFVTSATFTVKVAESVISDESAIVASREFGKLLDALTEIKDIEDKAERVQVLVDNIDKLQSADDIINRLSSIETDNDNIYNIIRCYCTFEDFVDVGFYQISNDSIQRNSKDVGYLTLPKISLKRGTYFFADSVRGYFTLYTDEKGNINRFTDTDAAFLGVKTFATDVDLYITLNKKATNFYLVDGDTQLKGEVKKGIVELDTKIKLNSVIELENKSHEVFVEKDGSGNFTQLKDAVEYSNLNANTTIHVGSGIYNLIEEFGDEYFEKMDSSSSNQGLHIGNNVHIIFSSNAKVTCNYTGNNTNVHKFFSPFTCLILNGQQHKGFTLENLNLECSNVRYAIHDEVIGQKERYVNKYKNCRIKIDNTGNKDWNNRQCIGGGLGGNGYINIESCYFESVPTSAKSNGGGIVSYHCGKGQEGDNYCSKVNIQNSYFANKDTVRCSYYGRQTTMSTVAVNNCSVGSKPYCGQENVEYSTINMRLLIFNNEIREE